MVYNVFCSCCAFCLYALVCFRGCCCRRRRRHRILKSPILNECVLFGHSYVMVVVYCRWLGRVCCLLVFFYGC